MSTDQSLATLLRALQSLSGQQDISKLLDSATNLFVLLSNPSNVSLLASQILSAPAIWGSADHVETVVRVIDLFTLASVRRLQFQAIPQTQNYSQLQSNLSVDDWAIAVIKGAEGGIPQSKRLLALVGLLQGHENQRQRGVSTVLRTKLQDSLISAINLSLHDSSQRSCITDSGLVIAVGLVFDVLDGPAKISLHHHLLLPMVTNSMLLSDIGLRRGYFLSTIDTDIIEGQGKKFNWSTKSNSYHHLQSVASGPLIVALGRLSRLAAFSIGQIDDAITLPRMLRDLSEFSRSISIQWRQNKLSEIDVSEEVIFLSDETRRTPLPLLWRMLRTSMFTIVVLLTACMERLLSNDTKETWDVSTLAIFMLRILRDVYFISSRLGTDALSQYSFVYLAAIDMLSPYPGQAEQFIKEIQPAEIGRIPEHPLDRSMDLYFLNIAEYLTPVLDRTNATNLLMPAVAPYLRADGDPRLLQLFEAAHSVMLAVLAAPQNSDLASSEIESYTAFLFQAFPRLISPRQFRFAIKHLIRITSSPWPVSRQQPSLSFIILEVVYDRLKSASPQSLPESSIVEEIGNGESMSEQAVLVLALIDSLPFLPIDALEDWLPVVARSIRLIKAPAIQYAVKQRFWGALSNGEMDIDRAELCVTWWGARGAREILLYGGNDASNEPLISDESSENCKL